MGSFRSEGRGGFGGRAGGSRFGGGRSFGDRDSGRFERRTLEMHDATCDKCNKKCQVPFRPTSGKPVYCSNCFKSEGSGNSFDSRDRGSSFGSRDRDRPSSSGMTSDQFKVINVKLDKIIDILNTLEIDTDEDSDDEEDLEVASDEELSENSGADSNEKDKDVKDDSDDDSDDDDLDDDSDEETKTI